jgi:DNA-binding transcriptional regulator YiaG
MQKTKKHRITKMTNENKGTISKIAPKELRVFRAKRLKEMRKNVLGLTQKDLANAVGVKLRTLQDWELGRNPMPKPVEILMNLMKEMPDVKKMLLNESI